MMILIHLALKLHESVGELEILTRSRLPKGKARPA